MSAGTTERTHVDDLQREQAQWAAWIDAACASVGVDPAVVDVPAIHDLTKEIAHGFSRPMAPVGAFILGVAIGLESAAGPVDPARRAQLIADLEDTIWTVQPPKQV